MQTMTRLFVAMSLLLFVLTLTGCATTPSSRGAELKLEKDVQGTIALFKAEDPGMREFFDSAYGYAVFPTVGKGAVGVGGAHGRGLVFEQGEVIGYCSLSQGTIGFQLGGQAYREVIFFEYKEALDHFKTGNFAFSAQASAVAVTAGASADAKYDRGVAVFTMPRGGLMFEASVGGQKFDFEPK